MFAETLENTLDDFGYDQNVLVEGTKLTANNGADDESKVSLEVETTEDDEVVKATITHPDGVWTATFHTHEDRHEDLASVLALEYQYWCEL